MNTKPQRERARMFHDLHRRGAILVLPNAWDAASARVFELAGFPAVGTTSAGLAWSLGYPDGQKLPIEMLASAVRRIVETVRIPVTADVEAGYGDSPEQACATVRAVVDAGAIGVNLEDGTGNAEQPLAEPHVLAAKIEAVRRVVDREDLPLFVNARTDVYLAGVGKPADRLPEALRRIRAYEEAGANGAFVPGVSDPREIAELARATQLPLNVYAGPGVPDAAELERLGVARVSVGCGPMQAILAHVRRIAEELRSQGTYESFARDWLPYGDANRMFERR